MQEDLHQLQQLAEKNDAESFAALAQNYAGLVYGTCLRILGNSHDAEELTQDCFIQLAHQAAGIRTSLGGWLHRVATTRALNRRRNETLRRQREGDYLLLQEPDRLAAAWRELEPHVDTALAELPAELGEPLVMHYLQGLNQTETAARLGVNQATVSRRMERGVAELRTRLAKVGIGTAALLLLGDVLVQKAVAAPVPATLTATLGKLALTGGTGMPAAATAPATGLGSFAGKLAAGLLAGSLMTTGWLAWPRLHATSAKTQEKLLAMPTPPAPPTVMPQGTATPSQPGPKTPENPPATLGGSVRRDQDRVWIEGVPTLNWDMGKTCTFAGSLEAALSVTKHPVSYAELMGVSGLAFRTRWYQGTSGQRWCPSSPVGEFPEEIAAVEKATGWQLRTVCMLDQKDPRMEEFQKELTDSIDRGIPVPAYEPKLNLDVIFGYRDGGHTLLLRDYFKNGQVLELPVEELGPMFIRPAAFGQPLPPRAALLQGLSLAMRQYRRSADPVPDASAGRKKGDYEFGANALTAWAKDIGDAGSLTDKERELLFFVSWWNFSSLVDARDAAVIYLRERAPLLENEGAAALQRAADLYQEETGLLRTAYAQKDAFLGPWSGKGVADWTPAVCQREQQLLTRAAALENQAVAEIAKVLAAHGK